MLENSQILGFAIICLIIVVTPGPNMVYLISRTICQGRLAGFISLTGIASGFLFYMLCASLGLTQLIMAIPYAYDSIKVTGTIYLLWLAWQAIKPNAIPIFQFKNLLNDSPIKLFSMGFITNLLNPKIAVMYLSLLPQFIHPKQGNIFLQSVQLGILQIVISISVNTLIVISAGTLAIFLQGKPLWAKIQRWLMGTVLAGLAFRILLDSKH